MSFDPVAYAREELVPLLRALCVLAESSARPDQERFFAAILAGIECARDGVDLAEPFMELSTSAFRGFRFDSASAMLLDDLLAKAQDLTEVLSVDESVVH
jgi:hypothetical protein